MRLLRNEKLIMLTTLVTIFLLIEQAETRSREKSITYKKAGSCGKNNDGILVRASNEIDRCYTVVNPALRCGLKLSDIPLKNEVKFIDHPVGKYNHKERELTYVEKLPRALVPGDALIVGFYANDTISEVSHGLAVEVGDEESKISSIVVTMHANGNLRLNSDFLWNTKNKRSIYLGVNEIKYGKLDHVLHVLIMNHFFKYYTDNKHRMDGYLRVPYDKHLFLLSSTTLTLKYASISKIDRVVKNASAAEDYCKKHHGGHLIVYESEAEKHFLDAIILKQPFKTEHILFDLLGVSITKDGVLESYDGTDVKYLTEQLGEKIKNLKPGSCIGRVRYFDYSSPLHYADILEEHNCDEVVPTFLCKKTFYREITTNKKKAEPTIGVIEDEFSTVTQPIIINNDPSNSVIWLAFISGVFLLIVSAMCAIIVFRRKSAPPPLQLYDKPSVYYTFPATYVYDEQGNAIQIPLSPDAKMLK